MQLNREFHSIVEKVDKEGRPLLPVDLVIKAKNWSSQVE
jgi:hypothetical protein